MPTITGILTFISIINATSERLKAINFFICRYFSFYEQLKFHAQLHRAQSFITSGLDMKLDNVMLWQVNKERHWLIITKLHPEMPTR